MSESAHRLSAAAKVRLDWAETDPGRWRACAATRSERDRAFHELSAVGYRCSRDEGEAGFWIEVRT